MEDKAQVIDNSSSDDIKNLIVKFNDARNKDLIIINNFNIQQKRLKSIWDSYSDSKKKELIAQHRGFRELPEPPSKWVRAMRRDIRYRIFRIREGKKEFDKGLKRWFELQFREEMSWGTFTFNWDISAKEPLKLIEPTEWDGNMVFDISSKKKVCDPFAFTRQEV